jgi:phage/plasmid-like protein (TIGR03299 family)
MTSEEALMASNQDFIVKKAKNHIFINNGMEVIESNSYSTYRTDNNVILGTVGLGYTVVQNKEGFDFIDILAGKENAMVIDSAGSLRNGETVFITAKLPNYIKLFGKDLTEMYVVFTNNHTGWGSVSALITPVRVVCNNTLAFAMNENERKITFRHTKNVHDKIRMADEVMEKTSKYTERSQQLFDKLTKKTISDQLVNDYLAKYFLDNKQFDNAVHHNFRYDLIDEKIIPKRKKDLIENVIKYYHEGPGQKIVEGTPFGLWNAVTGFQQNVKKFKNNSIKMESIVMEGVEYKKQNKLFKRLVKDFVS